MNDPHVVALSYNVKHSASVDYSEAKPLEHKEKDFTIKIENNKACFTMNAHYATEEEAREAVEEYIEVWELDAALQEGLNAFTLEFYCSKIEDRKPSPGMAQVSASGVVPAPSGTARATSIKNSYPPPPSGMKIDADVRSMFDRWTGYHSEKERLASMAYFCLTILEALANPKNGARKKQKRKPFQPGPVRKAAAKDYKIAVEVLSKIGELSSVKGGRKAGSQVDFRIPEKRFLEKAVEVMIHRLAAVADGPVSRLSKIELTDLPQC